MVLYNPSLSHQEGQYTVDTSQSNAAHLAFQAAQDVLFAWLTESGLKVWVRVWLLVLMMGTMSPLAFLPHPFAIANLVAVVVILVLNGRELIRVRGLNKNMGWQHIVGWTPVMIVNILCLTTDWIDNEQLTWDNAGSDAYEQARYVVILLNTITSGISMMFDFVDTILYHVYGRTNIERSKWTTDQLKLAAPRKQGEGSDSPDSTDESAAIEVKV